MTRRREFVRLGLGAGLAGLAGCPGPLDGGAETDTPTATGTPIEAPPPRWTTGRKVGLATVPDHASDSPSRVWATMTAGALTELRYPQVDRPALRTLEFVVVDTDTGRAWRTRVTDRVERSTIRTAERALLYEQRFGPVDGDAWSLAAEWVPDPGRDALLCRVSFDGAARHEVYAVARTACAGGAADAGRRVPTADGYQLSARAAGESEAGVGLGLVAASGLTRAGALTDDDGQALLEAGEWTNSAAAEGAVTLAGRLVAGEGEARFALGVAPDDERARVTAAAAVDAGYERARTAYVAAWREYLDGVGVPDSVAGDPELRSRYRVAAMVLAAVEDKTNPGASVASPSIPWGSTVDATAPAVGYGVVRPRDSYHAFTARLAMGDVDGARRTLAYVFDTQQRSDGSVPASTFVDGQVHREGEQLDGVALVLVMAAQLADSHGIDPETAGYGYDRLKATADYVTDSGPATELDRWGETGGYAPATIAATVAGLTSAASLAAAAGERADALLWLATADGWARSVEEWCGTTTGTEGPTPYYLRRSDDADPDDGAQLEIAHGGPTLDERAVVDTGFLELVRLGIVPADDPTVRNSVAAVDDTLRTQTPDGPAWYRYTGDAYGEQADGSPFDGSGEGRLWPVLAGERAEYELRRGTDSGGLSPRALLRTMAGFATEGGLLPEQVWDRDEPTEYGWTIGEATGSATPLTWASAQYVRLAHAIDAGEPIGTPAVVADRFGTERDQPELTVGEFPDETDQASLLVEVSTDAPELVVRSEGATRRLEPDSERVGVEVPLASGENTVTVAAADASGDLLEAAVALERRTVTYTG